MVNLCRNKGYEIPQLHLNCVEMAHSNPKKIETWSISILMGGILSIMDSFL